MRTILWLSVLFLIGPQPVRTQGISATTPGEPERVGFCDLMMRPNEYDGKVVTVSARLARGEGSIFYDDACKASTPEASATANANFSTRKYKVGSKLDRKLLKLLEKTGGAQVTVVGRFVDGKDRIFGHLNCCRFELEVQQLLTVDPIRPQTKDN